jgi:hypothetical protein
LLQEAENVHRPHYGKYRKEAGQLPAAGQAYAMLRFIFRMQKSK